VAGGTASCPVLTRMRPVASPHMHPQRLPCARRWPCPPPACVCAGCAQAGAVRRQRGAARRRPARMYQCVKKGACGCVRV